MSLSLNKCAVITAHLYTTGVSFCCFVSVMIYNAKKYISSLDNTPHTIITTFQVQISKTYLTINMRFRGTLLIYTVSSRIVFYFLLDKLESDYLCILLSPNMPEIIATSPY